MPSGHFTAYDIEKIKVRPDRQRREFKEKDINELAQSIQNVGLINPLVLDEEGFLVAGERRLRALQQLGWGQAPVQFAYEMTTTQLHLIELEENVKRVDLGWRERIDATNKYIELRKSQDPEVTLTVLADELGVASSTLTKYIIVNDAIEDDNQLVVNADKMSVAINVSLRARERKLADITDVFDGPEPAESSEEAADDREIIHPGVPLVNADFIDWFTENQGRTFNFIHCDFPYGVNMQAAPQGAADKYGGYADNPDVYYNLLAALCVASEALTLNDAHMIFWFDMRYYNDTTEALASAGWAVQDHPLIWYKSDNTGILPDPNRGPRRIYETALFCTRGDRKIVQAVGNCFGGGVDKQNRIHMSEKPKEVLRHFFRMVVDGNTKMLDPTCGSANAVKVAEELGAHSVLGIEKDPEFFKLAADRYND